MTSPRNEWSVAEALDRALAEQRMAPDLLDDDLADLVRLAEILEASAADVVPSQEFRTASRQRLLVHMVRSTVGVRAAEPPHPTMLQRVRLWAVRFAAGLTALTLAGAATASASASALPGDALYPVKLATEAVAVQLATNDSTRQDILLTQANTRLDETVRLLDRGRDADAAVAATRYDETVARLDVARPSRVSEAVQSNLRANEVRLNELMQTAPAPARAGLERALAATERTLGGSRASAPMATPTVERLAPSSSEQHQPDLAEDHAAVGIEPLRPAEAADRETTKPRELSLAKAGERGPGTPHEPAGAADGSRLEARPVATPADVETMPPSSDTTRSEAHGASLSDGNASPHTNPQTATTPPGRTPPERIAVPQSRPGGRGRP